MNIDYKNLVYVCKIRKWVDDVFIWSLWTDGKNHFTREHDIKGNCRLKLIK